MRGTLCMQPLSLSALLPHGAWKTKTAEVKSMRVDWTGTMWCVHQVPRMDQQGMAIFQPGLSLSLLVSMSDIISAWIYLNWILSIWRRRIKNINLQLHSMLSLMIQRRTSPRWWFPKSASRSFAERFISPLMSYIWHITYRDLVWSSCIANCMRLVHFIVLGSG